MAMAQKIEVGSSTIFRSILIVLAFWFVFLVRDIVVMLFAAFILASAIEPVANFLKRYRLPRGISILLVYILAGFLLFGFGSLAAEPIAEQSYQLAQSLPNIINRLGDVLPVIPEVDQVQVVGQVQSFFNNFGRDLANVGFNIFEGTRTVFSRLFTVIFVVVLAYYLALEKDAVKKFANLITPTEHQAYVSGLITRAQKSVGRWILGLVTLGSIVGLLIGTGLWLLGVPYALLLGILAGLMEVMPVVGPIIAGTFGVSVALSQSPTIAAVALGLYVVVGLIESYVLIPNIMKRAVGLKPLVTIIAVMLGARLGGVVGILLAVPTATILRVFLSDLLKPDKK